MQNSIDIFVFRTNVRSRRQARLLCKRLERQDFTQRATIDMEDCDRVLRVEGMAATAEVYLNAVREMGIEIEEL